MVDMYDSPMQGPDITLLLNRAVDGDVEAATAVWTTVHREVHAMAVNAVRNEPNANDLEASVIVSEVFLKVKVTILYAFFGIILLGGLATGRLFIKYVFGHAFDLDEPGWRKLTLRWGIFCLALAALNEGVWRLISTETWVDFKVWGILPLILLFAVAQTPLLLRHAQDEKTPH